MFRQLVLFVFYATQISLASTLVNFSGNTLFSDAELTLQLGLPEEFAQLPPARQDFLIRLSKGNLELLYFSAGYFSCRAELIQPTTGSPPTALYHIRITEGELYKFRHVRIIAPQWSLPLPFDNIDLRSSRKGDYDADHISDDLLFIRQSYRRRGYLHVRIDHVEVIDTNAAKVDVEFSIDPGNLVRMGNIRTITRKAQSTNQSSESGISDTSWVGRLWRIPEGTIIDGRYFSDFRTKLFGTQLFSQVRLEDTLRTDGSGLSDLTLTVMERVPGERKLSAFYEQGFYGWGVSAEDRHRNLYGRFNEGSAGVMLSQNRQELILGYANPLLFGTAITFIPTAIRLDNRIIVSHEELPLPQNPDSLEKRTEIANRGDITFGLHRFLRFRGSADLRFVRRDEFDLFKLKFMTGLDFNLTNHLFEPTFGVRIRPSLGNGGLIRGQWHSPNFNQRYWYSEIQGNWYLPLWGPLFSAWATDFGHFFAPAIEEDARIFYQGGSRTVRGYRFRSIFPSRNIAPATPGEDSLVMTGLQPTYWRISQELRLNLPGFMNSFQVVQFSDWAQVKDNFGDYKTGEGSSLGLGLRFRWQVLTLRLDYSFMRDVPPWKPDPFRPGLLSFDLSQAI